VPTVVVEGQIFGTETVNASQCITRYFSFMCRVPAQAEVTSDFGLERTEQCGEN
jgi:hypothetical protein